jgi:hypothetical protein
LAVVVEAAVNGLVVKAVEVVDLRKCLAQFTCLLTHQSQLVLVVLVEVQMLLVQTVQQV